MFGFWVGLGFRVLQGLHGGSKRILTGFVATLGLRPSRVYFGRLSL